RRRGGISLSPWHRLRNGRTAARLGTGGANPAGGGTGEGGRLSRIRRLWPFTVERNRVRRRDQCAAQQSAAAGAAGALSLALTPRASSLPGRRWPPVARRG